jgi:cytochrome c oxidase subunit 2
MILDVLKFAMMAMAPGKAPDPAAAGQAAGAAGQAAGAAGQAAGAAAPAAGAGPTPAPLFGGDLPSAEQIAGLDKFPYEAPGPWDTLPQASTFAPSTDALYLFIVGLSLFFFVLIIGAMLYFMKKYRRLTPGQKTSSITHNGKIEFLWSAIPAVLLVVIFVWGEIDFLKQTVPPNDAIDVRVTGQKWSWTIEYPDYPGKILTSSNNEPRVTLIVPKGRPVRLTMTSRDVIHSFYIPAFRIKRDVVPGRYTNIWFEATQIGEFNLFCAEYCGDAHSRMFGIVKVVDPALFESILEDYAKLEPNEGESKEAFGKRVAEIRGCVQCHSADGSAKVGPTWKGLWGKTETFTNGTSITLDGADGENYLKESINDPNSKVVTGFAPQMPPYAGQLKDEHIEALIAYIKSLK